MNKKTKEQVVRKIEKEIKVRMDILAKLHLNNPSEREAWEGLMSEIKKLEADLEVVTNADKNNKGMDLDMNAILQAAVGLTSILLILNYEKTDILTSKALPFAMKLIGR